MAKQLDKKQVRVLSKMITGQWYNAIELHTSLETMDTLHSRGLVDRAKSDRPGLTPNLRHMFRRSE